MQELIGYDSYLKILAFLKEARMKGNEYAFSDANRSVLNEAQDYLSKYPTVAVDADIDQDSAWALAAHLWNQCCFSEANEKISSSDGSATVFRACKLWWQPSSFFLETPAEIREILEEAEHFSFDCRNCAKNFCSRFAVKGEPVALRRYASLLQDELENLLDDLSPDKAIAIWASKAVPHGFLPFVVFLRKLAFSNLETAFSVMETFYDAVIRYQSRRTKPIFNKLFHGAFVFLEADRILSEHPLYFKDFCLGLHLMVNSVLKDPYFATFVSPRVVPFLERLFSPFLGEGMK